MFRKFAKKPLALLLVLSMLLGTLAGCGNPATPDASGTTPGSTADVAPAGDASAEIEYWNFFTGPDGENMKNLVDGFNATNPKHKVKNVTINSGDLYAKIPTVVNAKKGIPDLVIVDSARVPAFQAQGLLESMKSITTYQPEIKKENYNERVWDTSIFDGEQYALPLDMGIMGVAYNKDLVAKYCPDVLSDNILTIDEIKAIIPKAKADGLVTIPVSFFGYEMALSLITQEGSFLFAEDGVTPTINTPELTKAMTTLREIVELGGCSEDGEDNLQLFMAGGAIFCPDGIWDANALNKVETLNWGLTNAISYSTDKFFNYSNSNQFVLLNSDARTDDKEETIAAFLEYVRLNAMEWARSGMVPASNAANEEAEYKGMPQQFYVNSPEQAAAIRFNNSKFSGYANDAVLKVFVDILFGRMSVEDGLAQAQKQVEDTIAQNK